MKRKAMLMGMAVMTGLPGWALAKGSKAELAPRLPGQMAVVETADAPPGRAANVLAHMKAMLREMDHGVASKPASSPLAWRMELLGAGSGGAVDGETVGGHGGDDARTRQARPLGVSFRLRF